VPKCYHDYTETQETFDCCLSKEAVHVRDCFRLLWEQHIYWTRIAILGIAFASPDLEASTNRLLRNAPDFGRMMCQFYGNNVAAKFAQLIKDHLVIAAEMVKASKAGNTKAAAEAEKRWYKDADEISCFLNKINPLWPYEHMVAMWHKHLALTKEEAVLILNQNFSKSINVFNQIEQEALLMADDFSNGIICQFSL
jgi:hypothetical protein